MNQQWIGRVIGLVAGVIGVIGMAVTASPAYAGLEDILYKKGMITKEEWTKAKAETAQIKAEIEQTKAELEQAKAEATQAKAELAKVKTDTDKAKADTDAMKTAAAKSGVQAGVEKGRPFLRSDDGNYEFFLNGVLQTDFHATEGGANTLAGGNLDDQFLVRRARFGIDGTMFQFVKFMVLGEFAPAGQSAGGQGAGIGGTLKDGFVELDFMPELKLRVGQFKTPFSLDQLTSARHIDFVERSVVDELVPGRDVGMMLHGSLLQGKLMYSLGGFNGRGENFSDRSDDKDLAARLVVAPFKTSSDRWLKGMQIGGNVTWGDQGGTFAAGSAQGRTSARTATRFTFFTPHTVNGIRTRVGGDLAWTVGPAALKAEGIIQQSERKGLGPGGRELDEITASGWYVTGSYLLTGEDSVLNGPIVPKKNFSSPFGPSAGPGAVQVLFRWSSLAFDSSEAIDFFTGGVPAAGLVRENNVQAATAGLNWYLNPRVRLMFNWTNYWFSNERGTPFSCSPTTACGGFASLSPGNDTSWEAITRLSLWF